MTIVLLCVGIALLISASPYPREAAERTQCRNNLKQIGLAMHDYHDAHASFPEASFGEPAVSWRISLLPYVDQQAVYESFQPDHAWDSDANLPAAQVKVPTYDCPARPRDRDRDELGRLFTSYVVPTGAGTAFDADQPATIRSMTDGTTNTFLVLEACGTKIVWTEPRDVDIGLNSVSVNNAVPEIDRSDSLLSSYHGNGAQVLMADGSAHFVSENVDAGVLAALLTKAGGDALPEW